MEDILHQLIGRLSHYLQGFKNPRWWSQDFWTINSILGCLPSQDSSGKWVDFGDDNVTIASWEEWQPKSYLINLNFTENSWCFAGL